MRYNNHRFDDFLLHFVSWKEMVTIVRKIIEQFCGLQNKSNLYSDNKTLMILYSAFTLFFVIITTLLESYKTQNTFLLMFCFPFVVSVLIFALWLRKSKQRTSYEQYFVFQGTVTLAISFIWLFLSFFNIYSKRLGFSWFYICGLSFGLAFTLFFSFLRAIKWKRYITGKTNEYNQSFNIRIVSISIFLLLICSSFLKKIDKSVLYKMLIGGLFVLFFIFLTIALNMFVNYHIVKKYYRQYDMIDIQ